MSPRVRAALVLVAWPLLLWMLLRRGVFILPSSWARHMTLPTYLAAMQLCAIILGLLAILLLTKDEPLRWALLPDLCPPLKQKSWLKPTLFWAVLLAPLTYLCAYGLGMALAYDTLLMELANRGARAVQSQTGELGRTAAQDPIFVLFPFTVLIAPLGEELVFRGGVYGAISYLFSPLANQKGILEAEQQKAPDSLRVAGLPRRSTVSMPERLSAWGTRGGWALLLSSLLFAFMHADMEGGMGIVRLVSASVIGLACGIARMRTGSLLAPFLLHAAFNFLGLATIRGWLLIANWPTKYTIPTLLVPIALLFTLVVLGHWYWLRRARK